MNFDDKLREMARTDHVPLPDGYNEMLNNLYDTLAGGQEEAPAGKAEAHPMKKRVFPLTRLLAAAALIALMTASMAVGALAFSRETIVEVPKEVEVPVEVPVEPETIVMEELGLTLILPDSWRDKYVVEYYEDNTCTVYVKSIYEDEAGNVESDGKVHHAGMLFFVQKWRDYPMTPEQAEEEANQISSADFLLATSDATYVLRYASDVQWTDGHQEEYETMEMECRSIRVVVNGVLQ